MDDFLKMDIFFAVTTLVVVVLAVLLGLILYRVFRILGYIERISKGVEAESMEIRADIAELRTHIKKEGMQFGAIVRFFWKQLQRLFMNRKV